MIAQASPVVIAGETLQLFATRAIYRPATDTLLVADPHFGKAAAFRAAGVYVPEATTDAILERLDSSLRVSGARRVVFLGDLLHAKEGRHPDTLRAMTTWRLKHARVDMMLVRGNHDQCAGDPPDSMGIRCVDSPVLELPFAYAHKPGAVPGAYVLAGHIHPGVLLSGAGRQWERLPCFWFGANVGVLPAFGEFTGLAEVQPEPGDDVWVVAGDEVIAVGR